MPALYFRSVVTMLQESTSAILGDLTKVVDLGSHEISAEQIDAWREQIDVLRSALLQLNDPGAHVLLEYPIPRRGKRIDAVLVVGSLVVVMEFKCGARYYDRSAIVQLEDYCLDLRDFHSESREHLIVPVLVATQADRRPHGPDDPNEQVCSVRFANRNSLGEVLLGLSSLAQHSATAPVDPLRWNESRYLPCPTIIEAAKTLYAGKEVREITRCHAGADNLHATTQAVLHVVERARIHGEKSICFVTGVPGSGKTLAGLNIVHESGDGAGPLGVFLSGNGPLVAVLREALARDHSLRQGLSRAESRRRVETFIQNVHRFIDEYYGQPNRIPPDQLIVFDEAQRAWDKEQSKRKFNRAMSEPEILLDIMDRHASWAVIVALVGSGQEINTGEAGLAEWSRALQGRFAHWHVAAANGADISAKETDPSLHLGVSLRSHQAEVYADFVEALLAQQQDRTLSLLGALERFPLVFTRRLDCAKAWLRSRQRGSRRAGFIASSKGRRLRALGLDVQTELETENGFLNECTDVRSSSFLEVPATEFAVQGLELDVVGLGWDLDLVPVQSGWRYQDFRGTRWQNVVVETRRRYVLNRYRVLLTRAREGLIIWVPRGDASDATRPPADYDLIANYLTSCGIAELP